MRFQMNANDQIKCRISYKKAFRRRQCTAGEMKNYLCADYFPKTWTRLIVCIVGVSQTCAGNWKMAFSFVGNLSASEKLGHSIGIIYLVRATVLCGQKTIFSKLRHPSIHDRLVCLFPSSGFFLLCFRMHILCETNSHVAFQTTDQPPVHSSSTAKKYVYRHLRKCFPSTAAHRKSFFLHTTTMLFFPFHFTCCWARNAAKLYEHFVLAFCFSQDARESFLLLIAATSPIYLSTTFSSPCSL